MLFSFYKYYFIKLYKTRNNYLSLLIYIIFPILYIFINDIKKPTEIINSNYGICIFFINLFLFTSLLIVLISISLFNDENRISYKELIYSYPITKNKYLFSKYFAGLTVVFLYLFTAFVSFLSALLIAKYFNHELSRQIDDLTFNTYTVPIIFITLPNIIILFTFSFAFSIGGKSHKVIFFIIFYFLIIFLSYQYFYFSNNKLFTILDPTAKMTIYNKSLFWNLNDFNFKFLNIDNLLLANRLLWLFTSYLVLLISFFRYDSIILVNKNKLVSKSNNYKQIHSIIKIKKINKFYYIFSLISFELKRLFKFNIFQGIFFLLIFSIITNFSFFYYNKYILYNTINVLRYREFFDISLILLVLVLTSYVFWNSNTEKKLMIYSYPIKNVYFVLSKITTIIFIVLCADIFFFLSSIIFLYINESIINIKLLLSHLLLTSFLKTSLLVILLFFINILIKNKYLSLVISFFLMLYYTRILKLLNIYDPFLHYLYFPALHYSDFFGYGIYLKGYIWFFLYWTILSIFMVLIMKFIWPRYYDYKISQKIIIFFQDILKNKVILVSLLLVFMLVFAFIYYNTHFISYYNIYKRKVQYEKMYSSYSDKIMPIITNVELNFNCYPEKRKIDITGKYTLYNNSIKSIDTIIVTNLFPHRIIYKSLNMSCNYRVLLEDKKNGFYLFKTETIPPNDSIIFNFSSVYENNGFSLKGNPELINGSFCYLTNKDFAPIIGYDKRNIISNNKYRIKYGLNKLSDSVLMNAFNKSKNVHRNNIFLNLKINITTDSNSIAIANGELIKSQNINYRNSYSFIVKNKIINYYGIFTGDYMQKKVFINDNKYSVYYFYKHKNNVDSLLFYLVDIVNYYKKNFGNPIYNSFNIVEVPQFDKSYASCIQNIIKIRENSDFFNDQTNRLINKDDVFTLAHEIAHFWFGMKLVGSNKKDNRFLSESLAQYAALCYLKEKYGYRFCLTKLSELESGFLYGEKNKVASISNANQSYIFYRKAPLFLFSIGRTIGLKQFNNIIKEFVSNNYQNSVFPNSEDFIYYMKNNIPISLKNNIDEWFFKSIVYDFELKKAKLKRVNFFFIAKLYINVEKLIVSNINDSYDNMFFNDSVEISYFFSTKKTITYNIKLKSGLNIVYDTLKYNPIKCIIDNNLFFIDKKRSNNIFYFKIN